MLDKQELIQEVTETTTGQDLLDNIFKYLNLIETAYFGLRFQDNDNQTVIDFFSGKVGLISDGVFNLSLKSRWAMISHFFLKISGD